MRFWLHITIVDIAPDRVYFRQRPSCNLLARANGSEDMVGSPPERERKGQIFVITGRLYPFHQQVRWLFIILLLVVVSGLSYQSLRSLVEQHRLFHRVEQLTLNSLQIEGHESSYDPWRDLAPLTTAEGRAVAQQALIEARHLAATAPYDTEVLRWLGRTALLAGQPDIAVAAFSQAVAQRSDSPLIWFELGMAYEQLAPAHVVEALTFDQPDKTRWEWLPSPPTQQDWSLPVTATEPSDWWVPAEPITRTVFANEQLALRITLPAQPVVLSFWMGTPTAQPTTYRVMLDGEVVGTFELSAPEQGWHYGYIDLAPWAGQTVSITLQASSATAGWGDLRLIDQAAVICIRHDCLQRAAAAWQQGGFTADDFLHRGTVAFRQKQYEEALRWYGRVAMMGSDTTSTRWYTRYLITDEQELLDQNIASDLGWINSELRLRAWLRWTTLLHEEQRFAEVEQGLQHLIVTTPDIDPSTTRLWSEVYRFLALSLWGQKRAAEAIPYAAKAVELNERSTWAHIHYGKILYIADPDQVHLTEQAFAKALALDPHPAIWRNLIGFWRLVKEPERAAALCRQAQQQGLAEEVQQECTK